MSEQAYRHKVTTDALDTLGTVIGTGERRDAVHLAVVPAEAGENLRAGTHVGLVDGKAQRIAWEECVGIVDPFLRADVKAGQRFWLMVYPRVITSLRHVWTHPDIPDEAGAEAPAAQPVSNRQAAAEAYLAEFVATNDTGFSVEDWLKIARGESLERKGYGDYPHYVRGWEVWSSDNMTNLGRDANCDLPDALWDALEALTGVKQKDRPTRLGCSC